jgi:hypothetical protein
MKTKTEVCSVNERKMLVEDAQWNPGEDYLLVAYRDSTIKLFEMDKDKESFEFESQGFSNIELIV